MQKRPAAFLVMLFLAHGMPGQMIRSFPLENSRNPNAQVQLPWMETGDSVRNEAVNKRLWEHMLWGHAALGPDWADSGCAAVLRDLHDTMHGLQDAYTEVLWENDTLISFATHAEWLGTYLSHSLHRVTLYKKSGRIILPMQTTDSVFLLPYQKDMLRYRKKAVRKHLHEVKKLSGQDNALLGSIGNACGGLPSMSESWLDGRGLCFRLDCELPHALSAWDKEITFVIPWKDLPGACCAMQ
jgi:hypothetical protein